jgi:hypothetical protein
MKKRLTICLLGAFFLLTACGKESDELKLFFVWTQGYLASPVNEENTVALTLYEENRTPAFDFSEIETVQLEGVSAQDISLEYVLVPIDAESGEGYQPYALRLTYIPHRTGMYAAESVTFVLKDQTQFTYPIGRLVFDIGEADSDTINTWSSPVASSNPNEFPYQYFLYGVGAKLIEMKIGETEVFAAPEGLPVEGKITLEDSYAAPLVIIRAKLRVDQEGEIVVSYGKACYCGAMEAGDSIFERSLEHWASS